MAVTREDNLRIRQRGFREVLASEGVTPELMAKKLREELEATEIKVFFDKSKGKIVYGTKKLVAWNIRQKARMDAQRLLGLYPDENGNESDHPDMSSYIDALSGAAESVWNGDGQNED